jgi:RNA polymerase sigma-70 factor, ECF subfamily
MTADDEDAADARRVIAGDLAAFAGIVQRWQGRLITLAWRFCNDRTMAEDMAQEAFVKAFRSLHTFRGESAFSTWLTSISLNCYRSWLRERKLVSVSVDAVPVGAQEAGALAGLLDRERATALRRLVLTLPVRYREPIVMYYFQEMTLPRMAEVLRVPVGTIKARLSRGRALLARRFAARFGGPARGWTHGRT